MSNHLKRRINTLQQRLPPQTAWLLINPSDLIYFTGFTTLVPEEREAALYISAQQAILIHAHFAPIPRDLKLATKKGSTPKQLATHVAALLKEDNCNALQFDAQSLTVAEHDELRAVVAHKQLSSFDHQVITRLRQLKDTTELAAMHKASQIAAVSWQQLIPLLKPGLSEHAVKQELLHLLEKNGSEKPAFPTIVAVDANAALPHYQPSSEVQLKKNCVVLIDFGATFQQYRSDMTRTIWLGEHPSELFLQIEAIVQQAYSAALGLIASKMQQHQPLRAKEIDQTARDVISQSGYGREFIHTTGHGVGINIHESPSLNWTNEEEIVPGMVITIEPGIYLEGKLGYRHENTVQITDTGYHILSETS